MTCGLICFNPRTCLMYTMLEFSFPSCLQLIPWPYCALCMTLCLFNNRKEIEETFPELREDTVCNVTCVLTECMNRERCTELIEFEYLLAEKFKYPLWPIGSSNKHTQHFNKQHTFLVASWRLISYNLLKALERHRSFPWF